MRGPTRKSAVRRVTRPSQEPRATLRHLLKVSQPDPSRNAIDAIVISQSLCGPFAHLNR